MNAWILEDFPLGNIECQVIRFDINDHKYIVLFSRLDADMEKETISEKANELGVEYRINSYKITFDLQDNFDNDDFYVQPVERRGIAEVRELGRTLCKIIEHHYKNSNAEAYFASADNFALKRFYDRLANKYACKLQFKVTTNLGEEKLGYEIKTPAYKSTSC